MQLNRDIAGRLPIVALLCLFANSAIAANELVISSPTTGSVIQPGDTVSVRVQWVGEFPQNGVSLITEPTAKVVLTSGEAFTFSLTLPAQAATGSLRLAALGAYADGKVVQSKVISLVVGGALRSLEVSPRGPTLMYVGDSLRMLVGGKDQSGRYITLPQEVVAITSRNPLVISAGGGSLIATGVGEAEISVSYQGVETTVRGRVVQGPKGDLNGNGTVDIHDASRLQSFIGVPPVNNSDGRDLNRDGKIDALDVRVLTTLCTRPRCATED